MRVLHLCSTRVLRSPLPVHRARICTGRFSVQAAPPRLSTKPRRRSTHRLRLPPLPAKAAAVASRRPARNGPAGRAHRSSRWPHVPSIRGGLALAARRAPRSSHLALASVPAPDTASAAAASALAGPPAAKPERPRTRRSRAPRGGAGLLWVSWLGWLGVESHSTPRV